MGQEFDLPVLSQFYGTVPDPAWKLEKYGREWQAYDTVNATIGQGYMLANPLQLAVMASRLASGRHVEPHLLFGESDGSFPPADFAPEHVTLVRKAMSDVINGPGTAGRARLPIEDVLMAGKTGTAQVVSLSVSDGTSGPWKYRDHGLFIFFAPFDNPRYAGAVVIEHGGGSSSAYPIARDVMTFLFDPAKGMDALHALEKQWGGTAQQRLDRRYAEYASAAGLEVPRAPIETADLMRHVDAEARAAAAQPAAIATEAVAPPPEPVGAAATPGGPPPLTTPSPLASGTPR
jgi:penicillin-binding protein 2